MRQLRSTPRRSDGCPTQELVIVRVARAHARVLHPGHRLGCGPKSVRYSIDPVCRLQRLGEQVAEAHAVGADLHVDIMDGHFVPNITIARWCACAAPFDIAAPTRT